MHDGVPYDPIQGQGQGHGASEFPKIALFQGLSPPWTKSTYRQEQKKNVQ